MRLSRRFHAKLARVRDLLEEGDPTAARLAFDVFWRDTRRTWRGIAARLYQRWTPPTGSGPDDVEQELAENAWALLVRDEYDPTKGPTLANYIVFNACNKAKYWLHQQRGAILHGNRDKHPTRAPTSFDPSPGRTTRHSAAYSTLTRMRVPATQERDYERKAALMALLDQCTNVRERFALVSLYYHEGNVSLAARYIYGDPVIRGICRFGSEKQAESVVRHTANLYAHIDEEPAESKPPPAALLDFEE